MSILTSASKLVFILLALTASAAFIYGVVKGANVLESKDFMLLASMAFSFYFANKGETGQNSGPYLGK